MSKCLKFLVTMTVQLALLLALSACSGPKLQTRPDTTSYHPRLTPDSALMSDGYVLPMKTWPATDEPTAVVLAMHGFNDYSNAFDAAAHTLADNLITTYAIDQRGFGATKQHGIWAGSATMQADLIATVSLLCKKHSARPLFPAGREHGRCCHPQCSAAAGSDLHTGRDPVGPGGMGLANHAMVANSAAEATRVDAIYGLTDLMEAAMVNSGALAMPALIMYGEHDEIIPATPLCQMLNNLPDRATSHWRLMLYPDGCHMLLRDLQAELVIQDIVTWIHNQRSRLPSGQEVVQGAARLSALSECD